MRYNINDIVKIVKEDEYNGQEGIIVDISELRYAPVNIYYIRLNNGKIKYYFFSEINN